MYVRQMLVSDVDRVYEIACLSLEESYVREVFLYFIAGWSRGQLVVLDDLGYIIGFLSGAKITPEKATILLFAVDQRYRKKGAGSRMMEEFRARALMEGMQYIQLEVKEANAAATSFYKKAGFTIADRLENFYQDGCAAVRMIRSVHRNS